MKQRAIRTLQQYYDGLVEDYVKAFFWDLSDQEWLNLFCDSVHGVGARILDVGCGPGNFSRYLAQHNFDVTGVDISPRMIATARLMVPAARFLTMSMQELSFSPKSFDGILCAYSLLHLSSSEVPNVLGAFFNILSPGGTMCLIVKEGTGQHLLYSTLSDTAPCFVQLWHRKSLSKHLQRAGFLLAGTDNASPASPKEYQYRKLMFLCNRPIEN